MLKALFPKITFFHYAGKYFGGGVMIGNTIFSLRHSAYTGNWRFGHRRV